MKERFIKLLDLAGLNALGPAVRLAAWEEPARQVKLLARSLGAPLLAVAAFLALWSLAARSIQTRHGSLPTPIEVVREAAGLVESHFRSRAEERKFLEEQAVVAEELQAESGSLLAEAAATQDEAAQASLAGRAAALSRRAEAAREKRFSAGPTYLDQILTSLTTVFAGFLVASIIAVPVGILGGLCPTFQAAISPLVHLFKPVSPLAWLPIVMIVVGALYTTDPREAWFQKSFLSSAFTVALCSLWPTLVNTGLGVASVDKDHMNVARVLQLNWLTRVRRIIIPSALPLIFTGLRLSLGVGWMVLIAAEMLAQNPGLGKFVWDMFQNGSSQTLAQITVAVFTIGFIGFLLDRIMVLVQRCFSHGEAVTV